jgi:hypothetical protein
VSTFLEEEIATDWFGLRSWLNGDTLPFPIFLPLASAARESLKIALLRPSRRLVLEEYLWLKEALPGGPSGPGRPEAPPSLRNYEKTRRVASHVVREAIIYVVRATDPENFLDGTHAALFRLDFQRTYEIPEAEDAVVEKLASAPGTVGDPSRLLLWHGSRLVELYSRALRLAGEGAATELRGTLEQFTGIRADMPHPEYAAEIEAWYHENGDFLEIDVDQLPPRPFGGPWVKIDLLAKFLGSPWPRPPRDDVVGKAFGSLPVERQTELADESHEKRSSDFPAWLKWMNGELEKLKKKSD